MNVILEKRDVPQQIYPKVGGIDIPDDAVVVKVEFNDHRDDDSIATDYDITIWYIHANGNLKVSNEVSEEMKELLDKRR